MTFYENFVRLCNKAGKTPSRAATEIGISKSIVSRWKNGGGLTDATATKIADYFGVSIEELKGMDEPYYLSLDSLRISETEKAPSENGEGEVPHEQFREVLAGHGIRLLLDADSKVTKEQLEDIVDFINFQQRKNGR